MPTLNILALTKGEIGKLNALKRAVGDELGEEAMVKWLSQRSQIQGASEPADPMIGRLEALLEPYSDDRSFRLGLNGYSVKRARRRGDGAQAFVVTRNAKPGS